MWTSALTGVSDAPFSVPPYPQPNGQVKRAVQTVKKKPAEKSTGQL